MKGKTQKQILGKIGEDAVSNYLLNKGYKILERNYLKKCGELDIIAEKEDIIHFIEVKSVSREIKDKISQETGNQFMDDYRAEDNMHRWKADRLKRTIETYILEKDIDDNINWQTDVATVLVDMSKRICRVSLIEDIVF